MAAKVDVKKCTGCGSCVDTCPVQAIKIRQEKAVINKDCVECGACIDTCLQGAIFLP